eukprot:m51a1_g10697 hypothetical protein (316) ;mRNA; r:149650-150597
MRDLAAVALGLALVAAVARAGGDRDPWLDPGAPPSAPPVGPGRFTVVTSASSEFFARLRNLVGSVQFWEPSVRVRVYDLGLAPSQLAEARGWRGVETRRFPFELYPAHVGQLRSYAWKPLVMNHSLGELRAVLYQDAGQELRGPLGALEALVRAQGHLFVRQEGLRTRGRCCGELGELVAEGTLASLGAPRGAYEHAPMCAGGIQAYVHGSRAHARVLEPAARCALVRGCIAPEGATARNHRFDQAVFSVLLHRERIECSADWRYWANQFNVPGVPGGVPDDPRAPSEVVLFSRRGMGQQGRGGPYAALVVRNAA